MATTLVPKAILVMLTVTCANAANTNDRANPNDGWTLPSGTQIRSVTKGGDPGWDRPDTDTAFTPAERPTESQRAVSLSELTRPLKGRSLHMILDAEKRLEGHQEGEAFTILKAAVQDPAAKPYALLMLGTEHLKESKTQPELLPQVLEELEGGLADLPDVSWAHSNLAIALLLSGDSQRALKEAQKGLQLNPNQAQSRYALGVILLDSGQVEEAKYHLRIAATEIEAAQHLLTTLSAPSE